MKSALGIVGFILLAGGAMLTVWNVATFLSNYSRPPAKRWRLINTLLCLATLVPPLLAVGGVAHPLARAALFAVFPAAALAQSLYLRSRGVNPRSAPAHRCR